MEGKLLLDFYKNAGAHTRLFSWLMANTVNSLGMVVPAKQIRKLIRFDLRDFPGIKSEAENRMWADHPDLPSEYRHVFYGCPELQPDADIDFEMLELMIGVLEDQLHKMKTARELALTRRQGKNP